MSSNSSSDHETYVPWKEGAEILGVSRGSFFYLVETGQVKIEPNRKPRDGRYCLADIMNIKEKREKEGNKRRVLRRRAFEQPVELDWMTPRDLVAALRLDYQVSTQEQFADFATYRSWFEKNPSIALGAFQSRDREQCLAYLRLIPIREESVIRDVLSGKRSLASVSAHEIEEYSRPGGYLLLSGGVAAHPDRPDLLYKLLSRLGQFWIEQYPERYIRKIYATALSAVGDRLIQHLFMAPRPDWSDNAYELDLARPAASKVIRKLKEDMRQKASLPADLRSPWDYNGSLND